MLELLSPTRPSLAEANAMCLRALRGRWKRFGLAYRLLPAESRTDLVAILAWHALVRNAALLASGEDNLKHRLADLRETVADAARPEPLSAIAAALKPAITRHRLSALLFHEPLDELGQAELVRTFETRDALLRHARRLCQGEARLLLRVIGRDSEREDLLATNLALGLQLTRWTLRLYADVGLGQLHVAIEDLTRHGVEVASLRDRVWSERAAALVAGQVAWARELLARGWPLCEELGRWHGRQLAFVLRWHAASLSALEVRNYEPSTRPLPAGLVRVVACGTASLVNPAAPRFA